METLKSIIESLLFLSDKPITIAKLKTILENQYSDTDIYDALMALKTELNTPLRGVQLEEVSGGYQLVTNALNSDFVKNFYQLKPMRLSQLSLETLAIIAYKQPVTKTEVDNIRGVDSGYLLRTLLDRKLVRLLGKSDLPGKPMQYGTSKEFLEHFRLTSITELPKIKDITELLDERKKEDTIQLDLQLNDSASQPKMQEVTYEELKS